MIQTGNYWRRAEIIGERGSRIKTQLRSGTYYLEVAADEYLNRDTESSAYTLSHTPESTTNVLIFIVGGSVAGILVIALIWLRLRRNRKKEDPPDWTRANS